MSRKITINEDEYILFRQWMLKKIKENRSKEMIDTLDYFTNIVDRGKAKSKLRCMVDEYMCTYGYISFVPTIVILIQRIVLAFR